jgi:sugar phosphate isomerase/epimerase
MVGISLGSWAFVKGPYATSPVPLDQVVSRLAALEYDGIALSGLPPHLDLTRYSDPSARTALKRRLSECGLEVAGYSADLSSVNPTAEGAGQVYLELFRRNVELCADFGSPSIRVDAAAVPGSMAEWEYHRSAERLARIWTEAAEIAARASVVMLWEFDPAFVFNKPSEVLAMHRRVDHPNFQILFNTAHAYMCAVAGVRQHGGRETLFGGVPEFLKKLEGRVSGLSLIDSDGSLYREQTTQACPFGEGHIDFRALAPQLLDITKVKWWCVDLAYCPDAWDLLEASRNFVLDMLDTKVAA